MNKPAESYSPLAKGLHWLVALAVIALIPWGLAMKRLTPEGPWRERLYDMHEAVGALVLIFMIFRLTRRLVGAPAPDAALTRWDRIASLSAQYALYALLFAAPLLGWAGTNAYGEGVNVFGLFSFPTILAKDEALSERIFVFHLVVGLLIAAIATLHIAGALWHRFVLRDGVMRRMTWG